MKRIISIWLAALMFAAQPVQAAVCVGFGQSAGGTCNETAFFSQSAETSNIQVRTDDAYTYFGGSWGGATFTLCKAGIRVAEWGGNVDSKTYRVEVWSMSGTALQTRKGYSETKSGTAFNYLGATVDFTFSTPVEVVSGDAIVFTNLEAVDGTNFVRVYYNATDTSLDWTLWNGSLARSTTSAELSPSFTLYAYE